jgi:predicted RNase H-like HicB family nuclease
MKYRAIIKEVDNWWIGWLVDLPGVNAQEKTKEELMEALRIGAQEMLATEISFEPNSFMTTISIPEPDWAENAGHI